MVAAEGRDYAALILIVISQSAVNRVRVLFQQHQSDCLHEMNRMGAIWNPGPLLAAGKKKKKQGANFCRESSDGRTSCRWHSSDMRDSSVIYNIWLVVKKQKQKKTTPPTSVC